MKKFYLLICATIAVCTAPASLSGRLNNISHLDTTVSAKTSLTNTPEWTVLVFMQAASNLAPFAEVNLEGIAQSGSTDKVNFLVEKQMRGDMAWRYKIEKGSYIVEEVKERPRPGNIADELIDSARWAITNYPSKKFALILWNHGCGYFDPSWTAAQPYYFKYTGTHQRYFAREKGILFDDERMIFLANTELAGVTDTISKQFLGGNKIDLVGMDACNMQMKEVCYEMRESVKTAVGSEEYEFAHGWPYDKISLSLTSNPRMNSKELGQAIVDGYGEYWRTRTSYFTQSTVNLEQLDPLRNNIDAMVTSYFTCKEFDSQTMTTVLKRARNQALSFSMPDYVDIGSFLTEFNNLLTKYKDALNVPARHLQTLQATLQDSLATLSQTVTSNAVGFYLSRAQGLSIYFPTRSIDPSYKNNQFPQNSRWQEFIYDFIKKQ